MKSKIITNSQLSTTRPKTKRKTKQPEQTTGTGTESEMEIMWSVISREGEKGREGEKAQRISSINGRYKIDRGKLRIV